MPNFQTIASVMIQDVPSAAFSMSLVPPLGQPNPQLRDALKQLSATKYGKPRAQVEQEFFKRMSIGDEMKRQKMEALKKAQEERMAAFRAGSPAGMGPGTMTPHGAPGQAGMPSQMSSSAGTSTPNASMGSMGAPQPPSFLDEWLAKRQEIVSQQKKAAPVQAPQAPQPTQSARPAQQAQVQAPSSKSSPQPAKSTKSAEPTKPTQPPKPVEPEKLSIRESGADDDGVSIKLR
jgi:hypothetical protein